MSAASCEQHGGRGELEVFRINLDELTLEAGSHPLESWDSAPAGYAFVESGGLRGESAYLFSANDGRLRRGRWSGGEFDWEAEVLSLSPGFTSFALTHDQEAGADFALFLDAHRGYAEAWRLSERPTQLWSRARPEWRGLRRLSWREEAGPHSRALAYTPGTPRQETIDLEDGASELSGVGPFAAHSFARVGRHMYGASHATESSGAVAPTRLEVSLFDARLTPYQELSSIHEGQSWDHVELVAEASDGEHDGRAWLFRYRIQDGLVQLSSFSPEGEETSQSFDLPSGYTDFDLSVDRGELRILAVDEEGILPLRAERIDAMVQHLRQGLENRPGYEFVLMQSGHVLHAEAGGWARLPAADGPLGRPMTLDTRLNVASVSKLITAVTVLRLRDAGFIDLDQEFIHYLSPRHRQETDLSWHGLTIRELLTHNSSAPAHDCEIGRDGVPDCSAMLSDARELWRCELDDEGHPCCPRKYTNTNYQLLRMVLEDLLELHSNEDIAEYTSLDWLEAIGVEGAGCTPGTDDRYYRRTGSGQDDLVAVTPSEGGGCGQSGWHLSALDLARIARALRYGWVLTPESSEELFSCAQNGLLAWDEGWAGLISRAKIGRLVGNAFSTQSIVARLPSDIDVVVLTNSVEDPSPASLVRGLWFAR